MVIEIKCEIMTTWDYEHCIECRRFSVKYGKGLKNWRCKLNSDTVNEQRNFSLIWAYLYLQNNGMDVDLPEVAVIYVGKPKRKKKD
jgi:hypothetical protein